MEKLEIVLKFMKHIVWGLVLEGLLVIIVGILIFIYPQILGMAVGIGLIVAGIISLIIAIKVNRYSKLEIEL